MLKEIRSKIGLKMIAIFSLSLALSAVCLVYAAKWSGTELETFYASKNEIYIKEQAHIFLSRLTYEQAMRYEAIFQKMAAWSALIAKQTAFFLDHIELYGKRSLNPNEKLVRYPPNGIFSNDSFEIAMVLFWGAANITSEVRQEMNAISHVDPLLMEIQKSNSECDAAHLTTASGGRRYFPNIHAVTELPGPDKYDIRDSDFYTLAGPEKNPSRKTVWTGIYKGETGQGLMITASTPVYSKMGEYAGVAGVNVTLKNILNDILDNKSLNRLLSVNGRRDLRESLFSFLVDSDGRIIAFPREYMKIFGLETGEEKSAHPGVSLNYHVYESSHAEFGKIAREMIRKDHHLARFILDGHPYIVTSHSMRSTGWRLGVVIPESAVLASLKKTFDSLNSINKKVVLGFVATTSVLLLALIMIGILLSFNYLVKAAKVTKEKVKEDNEDDLQELTEDDSLMKRILMDRYLMDEDLEIEEELLSNDNSEKPSDIIEDEPILLTHSYNKMVQTLQKLNELEKEHSIELQREISERKRVEEEIRHLSTRLISSSEEGKKELAQDLHDEFGQTLAALHMNAESLHNSLPEDLSNQKRGIGELIKLIEHLGDKIRSISSDLRPDLLDDLGLVPTLEWYIKEFTEKRNDIQIDFQAVGFRKRLAPDIELVLYRIFQESINNIVKHANAKHVNVTLTYSHPNVIFVIKDDGVGFDEQTRGKDGIGLLGMRERVVAINGTIDIRSVIDKGTTIRVEIPVTEGRRSRGFSDL